MGRNGQALIAATRLRDVRADRTPGGVACNSGTGGAAGGSSIPVGTTREGPVKENSLMGTFLPPLLIYDQNYCPVP